jgi:hypothetical protein
MKGREVFVRDMREEQESGGVRDARNWLLNIRTNYTEEPKTPWHLAANRTRMEYFPWSTLGEDALLRPSFPKASCVCDILGLRMRAGSQRGE